MIRYLALALLLPLFACSQISTNLIELSEEEVATVEDLHEVSRNLLSTWPTISGIIRGGIDINLLPANAVAAMDELDDLATIEDPDDYDLGLNLGLRVRLLSSVIAEAIQQYAPDVWKLIKGVIL